MKRSPIKRKTPLKATKPLRQMSSKRKSENRARTEVLQALVAERGEMCEVCSRARAVDGHEKLRRSHGGSITDPSNIVLVCRECHDRIHASPSQAFEGGLLERGVT